MKPWDSEKQSSRIATSPSFAISKPCSYFTPSVLNKLLVSLFGLLHGPQFHLQLVDCLEILLATQAFPAIVFDFLLHFLVLVVIFL